MYRVILEDNSRRSAVRLHLQINGEQTLKDLEEILVKAHFDGSCCKRINRSKF